MFTCSHIEAMRMANSVKDTPQKSDSYMITNPGRRSTNHQVTMPVHGHTSPRRGNFGLDMRTTGIASPTENLLEHSGGHHAWKRNYRDHCAGVADHRGSRHVAARLLPRSGNKLCLNGNHCRDGDCRTIELRRRQSASKGLPPSAFAAT